MSSILHFQSTVRIYCSLLLISVVSGGTVSNSSIPSTSGGTGVVLVDCQEERECKAACGTSASDFRCNLDTGICICLNEFGPSRRCRNVKHSEEECNSQCKRKIAQVCYTDFGSFCSCFVRN